MQIVRKCHEIERLYNLRICGEQEFRPLESCARNLCRIEDLLSPETLEELQRSLGGLQPLISGVTLAENVQTSGESLKHDVKSLPILTLVIKQTVTETGGMNCS